MEEASPSLLVEKGFFLYPAACMLRVALLAKPSSSSWMCEFLWLGKLSALAEQTRFKGWSNATNLTVLKLCFSALDFSLLLIPPLYLQLLPSMGAMFLSFPFWETSACVTRAAPPPCLPSGGSGM